MNSERGQSDILFDHSYQIEKMHAAQVGSLGDTSLYSTSSIDNGVISTSNTTPQAPSGLLPDRLLTRSPFSPSSVSNLDSVAMANLYDPEFFEQIEREMGPVFPLSADDVHTFSPQATPLASSLSSSLPTLSGSVPQNYGVDVRGATRDQIRQQIENEIQKDQLRMFQQQRQEMQPQPNQSAYDDPRVYKSSPVPPATEQYEELLRAWANEKGVNVHEMRNSMNERKRKSEDLSDSYTQSYAMRNEQDMKNAFSAKSIPVPQQLASKSGEFDTAYAKSQLMDIICGEKEVQSFCVKVTNFVCSYLKVRVGGFYLNQRTSPKDWILSVAFPSNAIFEGFFQFTVGYHLIVQAATEKRCFCVHSTSLTTGSLSFIFVPIPVEETGSALAIMVLGTILQGEDDLHTHLVFLDQIRRPIATSMLSVVHLQQNNAISRKLEYLKLENDVLRQKNRFERALIGVVTSSGSFAEPSSCVICTDPMGIITYFNNSAQTVLGYTSAELIARYTPLKFHDPNDLVQRAKEIEQETGKKINTGFHVIVDKTARTGQEEVRDWTLIKKDGSAFIATVTIRPLYDEEDKSLIGYLELVKPKRV